MSIFSLNAYFLIRAPKRRSPSLDAAGLILRPEMRQ
jgi:hypothetical protein